MEIDNNDVEMKEALAPDSMQDNLSGKNNDLNSGFAKHIEKEKVINVFHSIAWPALEAAGWTKVSNVTPTDGSTRFFYVKVDLHSKLTFIIIIFISTIALFHI